MKKDRINGALMDFRPYLTGAILTLFLFIFYVVYVRTSLDVLDTLWLFVKTLFYMQLYYLAGIFVMRVFRYIFNEKIIDIMVLLGWIGIFYGLVELGFLYVTQLSETHGILIYAIPGFMIPAGALTENLYVIRKRRMDQALKRLSDMQKDAYEEEKTIGYTHDKEGPK